MTDISNTHFFDKCEILGELWLDYRDQAKTNEDWEKFFAYNDIGLPLAYMIWQDLVIVSGTGEAEAIVDDTWEMFCAYIDIDPEGKYETLVNAFDASPQPPLA